MRFTITSGGADRLGLAALCQRFGDEQWIAEHVTPEQAAEIVLDRFRRAVSRASDRLIT